MIPGATLRSLDVGAFSMPAWDVGDGPVVMLLHGFPDTVCTWRRLAPVLAAAGFRAVAVSMRGYTPATQPSDADYSIAALAGDIHAAIQRLEAGPVHLIGHDWGASIAFAAAAGRPDCVRTLTALAVPHPAGFAAVVQKDFGQLLRSWYVYLIQLRGIADRLLAANDFAMLERLWRAWSPGNHDFAVELAAMRAAFAEPGVLSSALAYYRQAFDARHPRVADTYALLSKPIAAPTLGIAGGRDGCVRADVFDRSMPIALFPANLKIAHLPDAGHFLHIEQPTIVADHIIAHLRAHAG